MAFLLEPLSVDSLTLKNRLVLPPIHTAKAEANGEVNQRVLDHYNEKSRGGHIGLIIVEHSYVSPEGKASKNQISVESDGMIENLRKLAKVIHSNGSKALLQMNHAGSTAIQELIGTMPVGPSAIVNPKQEKNIGQDIPHVLTKKEIYNTVLSFQRAAARVKEAGFDGVEIHAAHGYLLNQFFSPLTNTRTDEYGGKVLNRIRFHLEVIEAIREKVGADFPVFLRLGASDYMENGTPIEDSLIAAHEFEKAGIDALDISGGFCGYVIQGVSKQGYFSDVSRAVKEKVSVPVILTGGIKDVLSAERLLRDGMADLIGVGRAIMKDSNWAKNAIEELDKPDA